MIKILNWSLRPGNLCAVLLNQGIIRNDSIISVLTKMLVRVSDNSTNSSPKATRNPVGITV